MSELNQNAEVVKKTLVETLNVYRAAYQGLSEKEKLSLTIKQAESHEEFSTFGIAKKLGLSPGRATKELNELQISNLNPNANQLAHILEVALKMNTILPKYRQHPDKAPLDNYLVTLFKDKSENASNRNLEAVAILANRVNNLQNPNWRKKQILQAAQKIIPVPLTRVPPAPEVIKRRKILLSTKQPPTASAPPPESPPRQTPSQKTTTDWGKLLTKLPAAETAAYAKAAGPIQPQTADPIPTKKEPFLTKLAASGIAALTKVIWRLQEKTHPVPPSSVNPAPETTHIPPHQHRKYRDCLNYGC